MRKLYFALFLCVTVFSCSVDDVTPKLEMEEVKYTSMTKHEFILLLSGKCSDFEIEFLKRLPEDIEICVYEPGVKQYPELKEEECDKLVDILNNGRFNLTDQLLSDDFSLITRLKTKSEGFDDPFHNPGIDHGDDGDLEMKVAKSMFVNVTSLSSTIWGNVTSYLRATLNYEYDLASHKVLSATSIICDVVNGGKFSIDELVFDWVDKGSALSVDSNREGLIYNINGNVILGKAFGSYGVGFVCEKYRGLTGATLVPWE